MGVLRVLEIIEIYFTWKLIFDIYIFTPILVQTSSLCISFFLRALLAAVLVADLSSSAAERNITWRCESLGLVAQPWIKMGNVAAVCMVI